MGEGVDHIGYGTLEGIVFNELFVELSVVFEDGKHDLREGFFVFKAGGRGSVRQSVLIGRVGGDLGRDVFLEADLAVNIECGLVDGRAGVKDRVEGFARRAGEEQGAAEARRSRSGICRRR